MEAENIRNLINVLHVPHTDNAKLQYYAKTIDNRPYSIMPHTPFVYELFIFNSIYQIDWKNSEIAGDLRFHSRESCGEFKQGLYYFSGP